MARLWKTISIAVAIGLTVTACGAGAGGGTANRDEGGVTTRSFPMTGHESLLERARLWGNDHGVGQNNIANHGRDAGNDGTRQDGPLIGSDERISPFPQGSVRPLNAGAAGQGMGMLQTQTAQQPITVPYVTEGGERYIALDTLVDVLQFEHYVTESMDVREIGDKDVLFRLQAGSTKAEKEGNPFTLSAPPKLINGKMMLPVSSATDLFAEEMVFETGAEGLTLFPSDGAELGRDTDGADAGQVDPSLDFADDPNDPFKGDDDAEGAFASEEEAEAALGALEALAADPEAVPAIKNININAMIRTAKKYLGVPYRFGAGPYPKTNRFDCSSYTQYVFAKYGIDLPRTARAQARVGKTVSRKSLRKGDLLYFYVPGRFKTNKTIGHVGIYIGNRMMIHANTEPRNGVQLRSIDRAFWKKTFITAKRIAY
ncbi:NlpC/P60 family protein [Paenibacillus sp.]|uniref:C40 family peptidase n=1 Tax=Paenibacillus sp. TaxID=58172 RepID=UPI0028120949|nr:NlpC/P60 family protein [Paenibacillus sp.]